MQNILFIITKSEVGGAQKFVKEQIEICKNNFNIFLCTNQQNWLTQETKNNTQAQFLNKAIEGKFSILFIFKLVQFIKKNKIDIVVTNSANAGFYGRLAAYIAGKPSCYFSHGWSSLYNGKKISFFLNLIEKLAAYISTKVICVSQSDYSIALQKIKINSNKLLVIKNAALPLYQPKTGTVNTPLKVISLVRFASPKKIDLLIKSFEVIKNIELEIAGTGPNFEYWKKYIVDNNIKNIKLLNEVVSFAAFNQYDIFMLISDSEGLPISAIEAMSAGLPLILSNVGGCPELINNNGVLVENNTRSIVNAIENVRDNYDTYQANSIAYYNTFFNLNNVKNNYINLYKNLIN